MRIFGPHRSCRMATGRSLRFADGPHALDRGGVAFVRAVREVEPHDVDAGVEQPFEYGRLAGRRPEGGDDLGLAHRYGQYRAA